MYQSCISFLFCVINYYKSTGLKQHLFFFFSKGEKKAAAACEQRLVARPLPLGGLEWGRGGRGAVIAFMEISLED